MSEVAEFYDEFTSRQIRAGINIRHVSIDYHLKLAGLKATDHVLEVGCGVGTVSHLILKQLSEAGTLKSVDVSPKSVALAAKMNAKFSNASFEVFNVVENTLKQKFNCIVLPDVLEHIPQNLYPSLFKNLNVMLQDDGFIFIHIPHPHYLEWLVSIKSKDLQIIDNPVYTDDLLTVVYREGFYLYSLKSYSIYCEEDYQIIILKKKVSKDYTKPARDGFRLPFKERISRKLSSLLKPGS